MKKNSFKKGLLVAAVTMVSFSANADLTNGSNLIFNPPVMGGYYGNTVVSGSYFAFDTDGNGTFSKTERTGISPNNGLDIGNIQPASGSHSGAPNGSESAGIDSPWSFFGNTGMHLTLSSASVLSSQIGTASVDFSGWAVTWNGIANIPLGSGSSAQIGNPDGVAIITCSTNCNDGDTYVLDYSATVPVGDPSGFGGVKYALHLEGSIGVPVPTTGVDLQVSGGSRHECSSTGGAIVSASASVITNDANDVVSISWMVDGENIGSGNQVDAFIPLGVHELSVEVDTVDSGFVQRSTSIRITDSIAPELAIRFVDQRSGQDVTEVSSKGRHFITVKHDVADVCDSAPETSGVVSSVNLAGDGETIAIIRGVLATSAVNATANAVDASGRRSNASAQLLVVD